MSSVNYNRTEKLRFWCQKVLPIVYDDSLSYYELLNKVVVYLNSTIEDVQSVIDEMTTLEQSVGNKIDKTQKGVANGVATLDGTGKVPLSQLPDVSAGVQTISVNGVNVPADANRNVNIVVMTNAVSNLVNYYLKSETYNKSEVNTLIDNVKNSRFEVVAQLPTSDIQTNVIYLVPKVDSGIQNGYDEYINLDGTTSGWELIGTTDIDLSGYVTDSELATALTSYVTTQALNATLADYVSNSALATALSGYVQMSMFNTLSGVVSGQGTRLTQAESNIDASVELLEDTVGWIGENKFPNKTNTMGNNTYIVDSDGYVSTSVASDGRTWSYANSNIKFTLKKGTYKVRGYEKTASTSGYTGLHIFDDSDNELLAVSNWNSFMTDALTLTLAQDTNIGVEYKLGNGKYAFIFATAEQYALNESFEPYHGTVEEVKADKSSVVSALDDTVGWTGKNRFKNDANQVEVIGNVTITKMADGSIDVDTGGEGANTNIYWSKWKNTYNNPNTYNLPEGYYILSTGQARTSDYDVYVQNRFPDNSGWDNAHSVYDETGEGSAPWYHDADLTYNVTLHIKLGAILNHKVFKPMFTTPEIHKLSPSFEPFHESVEEMLTLKHLTSTEVNNLFASDTDITNANGIVSKYGHIVIGRFQFKLANTTVNTPITIANMPDYLKPYDDANFITSDTGSGATSERHDFYIHQNGVGEIVLRNSHSADRWIMVNFTYVTP